MEEHLVRVKERKTRIVNVIRFCATTIKFQNSKVLSLLQVFYRLAFDIVAAIIKFCTVADGIKYSQQVIINEVMEIGEFGAPV